MLWHKLVVSIVPNSTPGIRRCT